MQTRADKDERSETDFSELVTSDYWPIWSQPIEAQVLGHERPLSPIPDVQTGEICPIIRSAFGQKQTFAAPECPQT